MGGRGEEETAVPTVLISCLPTRFFPSASGYLLIGYSKISETRRYRRKKRGRRQREDERTGGRGKWDERLGRRKGAKREGTRWEGCRGPYARVGVNYHYPPKTRLSFCSPRVPFCFFPRCPTPPPPSESFDSSARLCHPFTLSSSATSSLPITVHLKYEFDITFHPTALSLDHPRANVLFPFPPRPVPRPPSLVTAVRPLLVPAQFNCWHFIKSIDSAPSCLRLCKLMPRPTGRELFLASAFVGIGIVRVGAVGKKKGARVERGKGRQKILKLIFPPPPRREVKGR